MDAQRQWAGVERKHRMWFMRRRVHHEDLCYVLGLRVFGSVGVGFPQPGRGGATVRCYCTPRILFSKNKRSRGLQSSTVGRVQNSETPARRGRRYTCAFAHSGKYLVV